MPGLEESLAREIARWEAAGLRRTLLDAPHDDRRSTAETRARDFSSNDYLGLAADPGVIQGARDALARYGAGGRASRLLGGGCPLDGEVERAVAEWLGGESALLYPTGYHANLGTLAALAGPGDVVISDELNHASLIDAARLSRATVRIHRHLDVEEVDRLLRAARGARRRFVITEGVFSMDGDRAPLAELVDVCARNSARLIVDEAHSAGVLGPEGAGAWSAAEASGADPAHVVARIVTGGKSLGVSGAFVVGARDVREHFIHRSRTFVYTTAVSPAVTGALLVAVGKARVADAERERIRACTQRLADALALPAPAGAIVPFMVGDAAGTRDLAAELAEASIDVGCVRPPTVPPGTSRLRIVCHAHNSDEAVEQLVQRLGTSAEMQRPIELTNTPTKTLFVIGTDTGVGKTVVSALLTRAALKRGEVAYWKPVQTGDESDTEEVLRLARDGAPVPERVHAPAPRYEFPLPASPHTAAAAAGEHIEFDELIRALREHRRGEACDMLIAELAGGLLVPYDQTHTQADLLARERLPCVLVARSGLGTLNHTLLTLEALRTRHIVPRALFLVGEPHAANLETLRQRSDVEAVFEVPIFDLLDGARLDEWIAAHDLETLLP